MMGSTKRPGEGTPTEEKTPPLGTPALQPGEPRSGLARRTTPPSGLRKNLAGGLSSPPSGAPRTPPPSAPKTNASNPPSAPRGTSKTIPPSAPRAISPSGPPSSFPPPGPASPKLDFGLMTPAARVVEELLSVRPTDRVVIVHDEANADVAVAFEHATAERGALVERLAWGREEHRPLPACPRDVLSAVRGATATVL
ncbi:MAG TPA: hypothetical protein VLS89_00560, partial [Candidatus Nanopelagicales bacterium]|nr:hypothetical protein [Candidatus Nanopelagicales bacterium]